MNISKNVGIRALVTLALLCPFTVSSCSTLDRCGSEDLTVILEIHYVYDPYGGAPSVTTTRFLNCGIVQLQTLGDELSSRQLEEEERRATASIFEDSEFWHLIDEAREHPPERSRSHGSFIAIGTVDSRIQPYLPQTQFEVDEIPNELRTYLADLEASIRSTFPNRELELLQPSLVEEERK